MIIVFRFAILFTVIVEIVPAETRAFCVGVFLFMMNMLVSSGESGYFLCCPLIYIATVEFSKLMPLITLRFPYFLKPLL